MKTTQQRATLANYVRAQTISEKTLILEPKTEGVRIDFIATSVADYCLTKPDEEGDTLQVSRISLQPDFSANPNTCHILIIMVITEGHERMYVLQITKESHGPKVLLRDKAGEQKISTGIDFDHNNTPYIEIQEAGVLITSNRSSKAGKRVIVSYNPDLILQFAVGTIPDIKTLKRQVRQSNELVERQNGDAIEPYVAVSREMIDQLLLEKKSLEGRLESARKQLQAKNHPSSETPSEKGEEPTETQAPKPTTLPTPIQREITKKPEVKVIDQDSVRGSLNIVELETILDLLVYFGKYHSAWFPWFVRKPEGLKSKLSSTIKTLSRIFAN